MTRLQRKADAIATVAEATKDHSPEAQAEAMRGAVGGPTQQTSNLLWLIFVPGLFILTFLLTTMVFDLVSDGRTTTDPGLLSPILSFVVGSLVGLFTPTPGKAQS